MGANEEQIAAVIAESSLVGDSHHYSSRRERIAAHLMAALIVSQQHGMLSLNRPQTRADLVAMALELTDTLLVQLAEDSDALAAPTVTMEVKP
ncbi:hypothetical protein PN499_26610 [Kamptonema animale CS-326]|jgi:hypothetical protein|uniref:hypothetical protein n=1 Tax=Kamptonema animale TaxID=92934 RepID=UPI00232CA669|nr:hypothetical protein [Kamptonema animale]MDB9514780.1 hypothetical protein [Kamptonema animale CS-326]